MRTLVALSPSIAVGHHSSSTNRLHRTQNSHQHPIRKWLNCSRRYSYSVSDSAASVSSDCNGWDDPMIRTWSSRSGESSSNSNQLIDFMISIGINDKKYVYVFVLGIVCSMAVSRVRLGWIVVLPVLVVVFGLGFALGFVRSVSDVELSGGGVGRNVLVGEDDDDKFGFAVKRLNGVVGFFDKLDARISGLRSYVNRAVGDKHVTIGELERYVVELDSARSLAVPVRGVVEACIVELSKASGQAKVLKAESVEKGKEFEGFGFLKSVGAIFGDKRKDSGASRGKEGKRDGAENGTDHQVRGVTVDPLKGADFNLLINDGKVVSKSSKQVSDFIQGEDGKRISGISLGGELDRSNNDGAFNIFNTEEDYRYLNNKMRFADNSRLSFKLRHPNEIETWSSTGSLLDSGDFSYKLKRTQREASFEKEEMRNESFESSRMFKHDEEEINIQNVRNARIPVEDERFVHIAGASSAAISDDVVFNRHLTEANELLKQATDCLRVGDTEDMADGMLYKSSALLKRALEMKPMSLLAVGLLGNTYLLHGELKLKVSRKLRALLRKKRSSRRDWQGHRSLDSLDDQVVNKDALATLLVNTCEECEHFLVEAGRKYRMAISIDGNDVKSLYNWGLALSFRAQLIADIGPEAAPDADKVYMAAIDKFDAMMSKGNSYAPDALYRWGAALQQRSRLRPAASKEKVKLLQQAKQLYEDALDMDSNNNQVKEALLRCTSELDF